MLNERSESSPRVRGGDSDACRYQKRRQCSRCRKVRVVSERCIEQGKTEGHGSSPAVARQTVWTGGSFGEPTIFAGVTNTQTIGREETFGPVLVVISYERVDDALDIANDSEFGLGGTVWTQRCRAKLAVAARVQTGTMGVNTYLLDPTVPFGGVKASGLDRSWRWRPTNDLRSFSKK